MVNLTVVHYVSKITFEFKIKELIIEIHIQHNEEWNAVYMKQTAEIITWIQRLFSKKSRSAGLRAWFPIEYYELFELQYYEWIIMNYRTMKNLWIK